MLHKYFSIFVVHWRRVKIPPPTALLEQLEQKRGIITTTDEATVKLEVLSFEMQLHEIAFVYGLVEFDEHLLFSMADEGLASHVVVLRQCNLELLCETGHYSYVYISGRVVCRGRCCCSESLIILALKLVRTLLFLIHFGLWWHHICLRLLNESFNRKLVY